MSLPGVRDITRTPLPDRVALRAGNRIPAGVVRLAARELESLAEAGRRKMRFIGLFGEGAWGLERQTDGAFGLLVSPFSGPRGVSSRESHLCRRAVRLSDDRVARRSGPGRSRDSEVFLGEGVGPPLPPTPRKRCGKSAECRICRGRVFWAIEDQGAAGSPLGLAATGFLWSWATTAGPDRDKRRWCNAIPRSRHLS